MTESSLRGAICNWLCCETVSNILEWSRRRRRRQTMIILPSGLYEPRRSLLIERGAARKTRRVLGGNKLLSLLRLVQLRDRFSKLGTIFTLGSALKDTWPYTLRCHLQISSHKQRRYRTEQHDAKLTDQIFKTGDYFHTWFCTTRQENT